jgi:hypothetical protein
MRSPRHENLLVVVADLDFVRISVAPTEADPPLVADAHAVLSCSVPGKSLQPVAWRHAKVREALDSVQQQELPVSPPLHVGRELP